MFSRWGTAVLAGALGALLGAAPATAGPMDEPLARFEDPICPGIVGLKVEAAETMVDRIRENAREFGRRLAPAGTCEPNLIVAIVPSGQNFVDEMRRTNGWVLAELSKEERSQLVDETGPSRTLLRVRARTRDGLPIPRRENLTDLPQADMWMAHSKIYTPTRNDIMSALVLFDRDAVRGLTIGQLADYATFRALTRALPQTETARAASIFGLFGGGAERPAGLTAFDKAYLGELYAGLPNIPGSMRQVALEKATGTDIFEQ